jgi:hypothetical protein
MGSPRLPCPNTILLPPAPPDAYPKAPNYVFLLSGRLGAATERCFTTPPKLTWT